MAQGRSLHIQATALRQRADELIKVVRFKIVRILGHGNGVSDSIAGDSYCAAASHRRSQFLRDKEWGLCIDSEVRIEFIRRGLGE